MDNLFSSIRSVARLRRVRDSRFFFFFFFFLLNGESRRFRERGAIKEYLFLSQREEYRVYES